MPAEILKFREWRAAEAAAQAAERQLLKMMLQAEQEGCAHQLDKAAQSAHALRVRAHALFEEAMQELEAVAESLHHRRILS